MSDKKQKDPASDEPRELLDYPGAERLTGLPIGTLYAMVAERRIPHVRLGRRLVRFERHALESWLAAHRIPVVEQVSETPEGT